MNKKIKNLFLAGAVIFSLAGVAVSCTDYDDDIDKLQDKTTTLETQVKDLTTKLTQAQTDITGLQSS
jgi:peptidoglycan hydrolase CwlO-like protein